MIVTPQPPPREPAVIAGPGVFAAVYFGGTGGRFEVAQVGARFFPQALGAFIRKVRTGDADLRAAHFVVKPYPDDIVTRVGDRIVEFTTPASHDGFGTSGAGLMLSGQPIGSYGAFVISNQPVRGVVAVSADPVWPNLAEFDVRLGAKRASLATVLIELEEQCLKDGGGC
jgi:hypothetical protein